MIMKRRPNTLQKLRKKLNWIKMATGQFPLKFNITSSVIDAQIGMFREDQEQLRIIGMKTMFSIFVKLWKYGTHAKSISPSILIHQGINVMKLLVAGPKHKPPGNESKSHYDKKQHRFMLKLILSRKKTKKQNKTGEGGSTTTNFWKPPTSVIWACVQNTK